jgi:hypothetical protein
LNASGEETQRLSRSVFLLRSFLDLQLHELFQNLFAVIAGFHFLFDVQNFAILANDESGS